MVIKCYSQEQLSCVNNMLEKTSWEINHRDFRLDEKSDCITQLFYENGGYEWLLCVEIHFKE